MRQVFLFLFVLVSPDLYALPVLNRNVALPEEQVILFPDHLNPRIFYSFPRELVTVKRYHWGFKFREKGEGTGVLSVGLMARYNETGLERASLRLRKQFGEFTIISLPLVPGVLDLGTVYRDLLTERECIQNPEAMEYVFYCHYDLTMLGVRLLRPYLAAGKPLTGTARFKIRGVLQKPDNSFEDHTYDMGLAATISDGSEE